MQDAIRDAKTSDLSRLHTTKSSDQHMILRDFQEEIIIYQSLNRSILVYFLKIFGDQHQNFICEIIF